MMKAMEETKAARIESMRVRVAVPRVLRKILTSDVKSAKNASPQAIAYIRRKESRKSHADQLDGVPKTM
jgi:hypothetical protein